MPPKKVSTNQPSKKTEQKKKEKIVEDKTFGIKNKKGTKQQKFIQQVNNQVKQMGQKKTDIQPNQAVVKKEEKKKLTDEMNQLFRPVTTQKVEKGVDPKSVLCAFFKSGQCGKGDKCKFSHDVSVERKSEKKSFYVDVRNEDNMENWDEEKLKEVVEKKHGEREKKLPSTDIICKHFIDALETNKYGWFWDCPNGGDKCHYRHCLPPGFVLNKDKKKQEKKDDITIEELVEIERAKLGYNLTKITLESFLEWKRKKIDERSESDKKESERKRAEYKAGKNVGLSGREMFTFNPDLALDEDMEEGEDAYVHTNDDSDEEDNLVYREINIENLLVDVKAADGTGTQCTTREFHTNTEPTKSMAEGGEAESNTCIVNEPIDESLFDCEDLDELDEEINSLSLEK
ncbi:zinc finger CCCH domain-containing protein 15-like [Oppia nitens]|uniref:zinc finger CCCH domain-containing protein 15-like n=1 Tax=Oppia nitens TaxID=1686743 RepID=UPI0023D98671|nr:zinc finger CCCH domain-containing protein 15-like [Oppia nitens]